MRPIRILCILAAAAFAQDHFRSPASAQPVIEDVRSATVAAGKSPTAGIETLIAEIELLEALQIQLLPVFNGTITLASEPVEIESARQLVNNYIDSCATMLVTAALQLGGTQTDPPSTIPMTTLMLGQISYVERICAPLEIDTERLYSSIILDPRFNDIPSDVQAAMIGRYVQELLLRPELTGEESQALSVVDNDAFIASLSELSGTEIGNLDIYDIDWSELSEETIWIRYYDEHLRIVERTVTGVDYDHRFGVILPPVEDGGPDVMVNLSRIETVIIRSSSVP
ncbi:MAG: hypothetical protein CMJ29_12695 [Phycisphaerae bacterium]|nr:hypothetical protein [Phycisphaerae bacterium]